MRHSSSIIRNMRSSNLLLAFVVASTLPSPVLALVAQPQPVGPEIAVNVSSLGSHWGARPALFSDGSFVVVWTDTGQKSSVHARFFDRDGTPTSGEFRLLAASARSTEVTSIVVDRDDSFLVAWNDLPWPPGPVARVLVQRFSRTGQALGPALPVHAVSSRDRLGGRLALRPGGGFAVAWSAARERVVDPTRGTSVSSFDVYARAFTAAGAPLGPELRVNETTSGSQTLYGLVVTPDGALHVFYANDEVGGISLPHLRRLSPRGRPLGHETGVSSYGPDGHVEAGAMSLAPDGTFTVAWYTDAYSFVLAREFAADGSPLTADIAAPLGDDVDEADIDLLGDLVALPDGDFFFVVTNNTKRDGSGTGIFGRAFGPQGDWVPGEDLQLNQTTAGDQFWPVLAGRDGRFVAAWNQNDGLQTSGSKVRARVFVGN